MQSAGWRASENFRIFFQTIPPATTSSSSITGDKETLFTFPSHTYILTCRLISGACVAAHLILPPPLLNNGRGIKMHSVEDRKC
jgi:hypothetical protein